MLVPSTTFFDPKEFEASEHFEEGCQRMERHGFIEAIAEFENVLKLDPKNTYAWWNRALARLSLGDYQRGFREHDQAWEVCREHGRTLGLIIDGNEQLEKLPVWNGEHGKRLFAYNEMGFGDAIMTLRFLPEIVRRCHSVTLMVRPELVRLMQWHGAYVVDRVPEDLSEYDSRIIFINSIYTLGHTKETIPSAPYIRDQFEFSGGKMGIAWSGTSRKEFMLKDFWAHLNMQSYEIYALQKCDDLPADIIPLPDDADFMDTAELMRTLDCIVTVDTAAAHLAGAIGHPNAHVVLPYTRDWRWWAASTWYPTLKIYAQDNPHDWLAPFRRINEAIHG